MFLAAAGGAGCATAPGATLQQLHTRAVFDLGCPQHQLTVYHVDKRTKAVAGCGRRLIYVQSCQRIRGEHACTWVLDTPTYAQTQWPDWQPGPGAPGFVVVHDQPPGGQQRPVATQLFDPGQSAQQPAATAPPPRPAQPPRGQPGAAPAQPASSAPPPGTRRRASPTDLFGSSEAGTSGAGTTTPAGRHVPTELFDPGEL